MAPLPAEIFMAPQRKPGSSSSFSFGGPAAQDQSSRLELAEFRAIHQLKSHIHNQLPTPTTYVHD